MRFLVTGANGFIGSSVGHHFHGQGWEVLGISRTNQKIRPAFRMHTAILSIDEMSEIVRQFTPDILFHAAGTASVPKSVEDPHFDFRNSVELFQTVLEGVRRSGKKPLVMYPSSAAVYGNPLQNPTSEKCPAAPISPYGYHKVICENLAERYAKIYHIPSIILRIFSVFGPGQKKLLIWELFRKFSEDKSISMAGTGEESRDYISIDVLTEMIYQMAFCDSKQFTVVNLGSGFSIKVRDIVEIFQDCFRPARQVDYGKASRPGDPLAWRSGLSCLCQ